MDDYNYVYNTASLTQRERGGAVSGLEGRVGGSVA
jgi:hypothetical protein